MNISAGDPGAFDEFAFFAKPDPGGGSFFFECTVFFECPDALVVEIDIGVGLAVGVGGFVEKGLYVAFGIEGKGAVGVIVLGFPGGEAGVVRAFFENGETFIDEGVVDHDGVAEEDDDIF